MICHYLFSIRSHKLMNQTFCLISLEFIHFINCIIYLMKESGFGCKAPSIFSGLFTEFRYSLCIRFLLVCVLLRLDPSFNENISLIGKEYSEKKIYNLLIRQRPMKHVLKSCMIKYDFFQLIKCNVSIDNKYT